MQGNPPLGLADVCSRLGISVDALLETTQHSWRYYTKFERRKRSGGVRTISASTDRLKSLQRIVLDGLLALFPMPEHVHGCVKGRSAVTNARLHVGQAVVINIDLSDFFATVSFDMVSEIFAKHFHFDEQASEVFARLSVVGGGLPQGAPTSPALANIAALQLDADIIERCKQALAPEDFQYSRYVDDITISGGAGLVDFVPEIYKVIERHGFEPNIKKTKILRRTNRQSVTGVVVNEHANVPKGVLREIRQQVYYCNKFGVQEHCDSLGITPKHFLKTIRGQIGYISRVKPELAKGFAIMLDLAVADMEETTEERTLRRLKKMIDNDEIASFFYDPDIRHLVAPASITVDPEQTLVLKAFQLTPEQGWRYFDIARIRNMKLIKS